MFDLLVRGGSGSYTNPYKNILDARRAAEEYFKETGKRCYFIENNPESGITKEYLWPESSEALTIEDRFNHLQIYINRIYELKEIDGKLFLD